MYGIVHPGEQWESDRRVRLSPFYERERDLKAVFIEGAGWERPNWYESNAGLLDEFGDRITTARGRVGVAVVVADHQRRAPRDARPRGDDRSERVRDLRCGRAGRAAKPSRRVAMRQMNVPIGRVVYTPLLTPSGGFKQDLTIMRLADDVFRVVTGGAYGMSDKKWFADHLPDDGSAQIHDQTNAFTTLGLWGPRARDILQRRHERRRLARGHPVRPL